MKKIYCKYIISQKKNIKKSFCQSAKLLFGNKEVQDRDQNYDNNVEDPSLEQFYNQNKFMVFPLKNRPIFPQNSMMTKISPYLYSEIKQKKIKYVSAFLIKNTFSIDYPQIDHNIIHENKQENSIEILDRNFLLDKFHQNMQYDIYQDDSTLKKQNGFDDPGVIKLNQSNDIYDIGTLCNISISINNHQGMQNVFAILKGNQRVQIKSTSFQNEYLQYADLNLQSPIQTNFSHDQVYIQKLDQLLESYSRIRSRVPINVPELIYNPLDPKTIDLICGFLSLTQFISKNEQQMLLEAISIKDRLDLCLLYISRYETELLKQWQIIESKQQLIAPQSNPNKIQMREIYQYLQKQNNSNKKSQIVQNYKDKFEIQKELFPLIVQNYILSQIQLLEELNDQIPEFSQKKQFLDLIFELPWGQFSQDLFDIYSSKQILDQDHYGLDDVKQRILEFIAVSKLKNSCQGQSLLLIGPCGVGKTSISSSIAKCLNRKLIRISLGGESDVAIIKGHRKTYMGSYPGKIIQALKSCQTSNPVILLDEIDKISIGVRGNIQDALLEVLDPEQNNSFIDNYLNLPFDISKVLFICSANQIDSISVPLLDRMEILHLAGYTGQEKIQIAQNYLIPKSLQNAGLNSELHKNKIHFTTQCIQNLIDGYAREPGVRSLERLIIRICEKISLKSVQNLIQNEIFIQNNDLVELIGLPYFEKNKMYEDLPPPGTFIGLGYNELGGNILYIESQKINYDNSSKGQLKFSGQLGDVMQESVQIAYTYAKYFVSQFYHNQFLENNDIHINFPSGNLN